MDESSPICDARLLDGSRVNVIAPPLSIDGATLTIRKFKKDKLRLENLVDFGSITPMGAKLLAVIGACRLNILVSGGTGSGKTTLLNALTAFIEVGDPEEVAAARHGDRIHHQVHVTQQILMRLHESAAHSLRPFQGPETAQLQTIPTNHRDFCVGGLSDFGAGSCGSRGLASEFGVNVHLGLSLGHGCRLRRKRFFGRHDSDLRSNIWGDFWGDFRGDVTGHFAVLFGRFLCRTICRSL